MRIYPRDLIKSRCPWGSIDHWDQLAQGVYSVSTSSNGGIYLAPKAKYSMPRLLQRSPFCNNSWWEEDIDQFYVQLFLFDQIQQFGGFSYQLRTYTPEGLKRTFACFLNGRYNGKFDDLLYPFLLEDIA